MGNQLGVGVYFDVDHAFVVELVKEGGSARLMRSGEVEFSIPSLDLYSEGKTVSPAIRSAFEKSAISSKVVAAALPARSCIVRYFDIPMIPKREWAAAVHFEAQKYVSLDLNDLSHSFYVFPDKKQKKIGIVFLASKKEIIHQHLELLSSAGLEAHYLEPASLSVVRALRGAKGWRDNETCTLVDLRSNGMMSIAIIKNNRILMTRDSFLAQAGDGNPPAKQPAGLWPAQGLPDLNGFIKEMKLTFNFFDKNFKNEEMKRIIFIPKGDHFLKDWSERLKAEFAIPFEGGDFSHLLGSAVPSAFGMIAAAGLALRELSARQPLVGEANLIAREQIPVMMKEEAGDLITEGEKATLQKWALIGVSIVVAAVLGFHFLLGFKIARHRADLNNREIAHTKPASVADTSVSQEELAQTDLRLSGQLGFLSALVDRRVFWTSKMNELARVTPPGIRLTHLEYADRENKQGRGQIVLTLQGVVISGGSGSELDAPALFVSALKQDQAFMEGFHEVKLSAIRKVLVQNTEKVNFEVLCSPPKTQEAGP